MLYRLPMIMLPLHYTIGALGIFFKMRFTKCQARGTIPRRAIEITTKRKMFKKDKKHLITHQSQLRLEANTLLISKKKKKPRLKIVTSKKDFFS